VFDYNTDLDNSSILQSWNNQVADVEILGRTLYKDGDWNTLCLPFDVTIEGSPLDGDGVDVRTLADASFAGGTLTLDFTEAGAVTTLSAGVPYIIRWNNTGQRLTSPRFNAVTIDNTLRDQYFSFDDNEGVNGGIAFRGTYAPITYTDEDKSILFLGAANTLYYPKPGEGNDPTIGAFRAYFELNGLEANPDAGEGEVRAFVLNFGDDDAVGITTTTHTKSEDAWYSIDGKKLGAKPTQKGLYIHNGRKCHVK
jgi:hypothetical protein